MLKNLGPYSKKAFGVITLVIFLSSFFYYPKWNKTKSESTISWDVSGYYIYLPAIFIYDDLKQLTFYENILKEYEPTPDFQQAYPIDNGNRVCKYTSGMAIQYFPFFIAAHIYSKISPYKSDGYSTPYQFAIQTGSFIYGIIGLLCLFLILRMYFNDKVTAATCLCICLASNYLEYVGITSAMAHNYLFMWYALLILVTIKFRQRPDYFKTIMIGLICGLMALTRPTEIIVVLIPLFWGFSFNNWKEHLEFLNTHLKKIITAASICLMIGSLQLVYWKYVSGSFIQYSYEDQGFSWLRPHLFEGFFSFEAGWLIYSPIMICSVIGMYFIRSKKDYGLISIAYASLFIYIAFAWDIWWYGGSLGQRTMVQILPILAFPFAAFLERIFKYRLGITSMMTFTSLCLFGNLWLTHQAHRGSYFHPVIMSQSFFLHAYGKNQLDPQTSKLLDTRRINGEFRKDLKTIHFDDMIYQNSNECSEHVDNASCFCLTKEKIFSPKVKYVFQNKDFDWIRVNSRVKAIDKETNEWRNTHLIVEFKNGPDQIVRKRAIKLNSFLNGLNFSEVFLDVRKPRKVFDHIETYLWHAGSETRFAVDKIWIESYKS